MQLREIMTPNVESISPSSNIHCVARKMRELDVGAIPLVENGKPVGIVTDRDIAVRAVAERLNIDDTKISEIMTPDVVTLPQDESVEDAAKVMEEKQIRRVLVTDDSDRIVGIVALSDLACHVENDELKSQVLERVSQPA